MTQKVNTILEITDKELSIQLSLNGLSFCVLNTSNNTITAIKHFSKEKKLTPFELLDFVKHLFNTESLLKENYNKVTVIHTNELSALVPQALFNEDAMADYLKLSSKILKSDYITYDTITANETVNVYVPYINVNNFIYDHFGAFTYKHFSTVLIENLVAAEKNASDDKLYINVNTTHFELLAFAKGKLLLYNTFEYTTPEDFIYYVLFTTEQLEFNPETISAILLGAIEKDDTLYNILYKYIRNVSFGNRMDSFSFTEKQNNQYSNFTLLKSL
ncbi:DUF3822 family protein [Lacinutrix sp. MedPE-SW]|uniref:DUF3822 family protein n=1 Tax=Lacinutrix sp. MedPE-SW TaxID=1860087 RepID=UPI00091A7910|nr:DUF3822 family protein [Lacinutrix sp. MedPE-SW]OIQ16040.1 MAG: hypothetical protein BM549_13655 [Lacinutrix sp. MedPE-SW]